MNGEIQQASDIVISARKALFDNKEIDFTPGKYVQSIKFYFESRFLFHKTVRANSVCEWFDICLRRGLKDIKFFIRTNRDNKHLLGFANISQPTIVCFGKKGNISLFCPAWECDQENEGWKIIYSEQSMSRHSFFENVHFVEKIDEFKEILMDIEKFSVEIEQPYFSEVFHKAYLALCNSENIEDDNIPKQLPNDYKSIYYAVDKADVFGAMGSWNDSPSWYAQKNGLQKEFNELSDRLLVQLRYHLMYVVNECWKKD